MEKEQMKFPLRSHVRDARLAKNREAFSADFYCISASIAAQLRHGKKKFTVIQLAHKMSREVKDQLRAEIMEGLRTAGWFSYNDDSPIPTVRVRQDWFEQHNSLYWVQVTVKIHD